MSLFMPALSLAQAPHEDAIRYRKAVMVLIKWHYDQLGQQAKGRIPFSRDAAQRHAAWLDALGKSTLEGFVPDSHEGETKALPAIWSNWEKFRGLGERFQIDAQRLREIARDGDAKKIKNQLDDMTKTCKSCHDDFKKSS